MLKNADYGKKPKKQLTICLVPARRSDRPIINLDITQSSKIHWNLCRNTNVKTVNYWWEHKPKNVMENK